MAQKKAASGSKGSSTRKKRSREADEALERYNKAVEAFGRAVKNVQKGDWSRARAQLDDVISTYPDQRELVDRARAYAAACDRRTTSPTPAAPQVFEEMVAQGVFYHNLGDYRKAVDLLVKAVEMEPKSDHANYCLAAAYARDGDAAGASRHLKRAINANSYNLFLARSDSDFESLRDDPSLGQIFNEEPAET